MSLPRQTAMTASSPQREYREISGAGVYGVRSRCGISGVDAENSAPVSGATPHPHNRNVEILGVERAHRRGMCLASPHFLHEGQGSESDWRRKW